MKILIYNDEGVSSFSLSETLKMIRDISSAVEVVDHRFLNEKDWEKETKLIVFPGGRDIPYDRNLKGKGTKKIRKFVEEGGNFLGICAGAYFAADEVVFEKGTSLEVHEKRELKFFPGSAIGTLYPEVSFSYESKGGIHPAEVSFENHRLYLYYNGGCTFEDSSKYPGVKVLAHYLDAQNQPAIIHCKVGKGNVILSGVHIEVRPSSLEDKGCEATALGKLKQSDSERKHLIATILEYLL